jgi:ABC-2 type transport system ATP-binding protein
VFKVENLSKRFGDIRAVNGISFEVRQGEIYGLLGPNGAGKTTTLSMLTGLLRPDEGQILFDGVDIDSDPIRVKSQLGVAPQENALYEELSGRENLRFWAGMYGLSGEALNERVLEALDQVGLTSRSNDRVKTFSGGMKRRLNLALALAHRPRVLLLDEPTAGIDPQARMNILDVVRRVASSGTTIIYTTHYLEEAEQLCERIAIMDHGKILAEGTLDELKRMVGEEEVITIRGSFNQQQVHERLHSIENVRLLNSEDGHAVLASSEGGSVKLLSALFGGPFELEGVSIAPPSLNGLFLKLTGRELRD